MANFMQLLMQEAERAKRNLKAAPGHIADQVSNFKEDWKGKDLDKAVKQEQLKPEQLKAAMEEVASNAIPGGAGAAGILGGAGRQDLVLTRGMDVTSLLSRLINSKNYFKQGPAREKIIEDNMRIRGRTPTQNYDKDAPILRAPSLAIHHTDKQNQFDNGVTLVMNPDKFDPANTARSKLYNRDVYTKRSDADDFFRKEWHGKPAVIDPRMTERLDYDVSSMDEWIQGLASPKFKSFAEYEASRQGAGTLDTYKNISVHDKIKSRMAFRQALTRDLQRNEFILDVPYDKLDTLTTAGLLRNLDFYRQHASSGGLGDTSKRVMEVASKMPAAYAELKYAGDVPMDAENLLGIILGNDTGGRLQKVVSAGFPGVPVISKPITGSADQYVMDMLMEQLAIGRKK